MVYCKYEMTISFDIDKSLLRCREMDEKKQRMDVEALVEKRSELVVKSNELIRNARYSLTEVEQKILIYVMSKVKRDDTELKKVHIDVKDYCEIAGIKAGGGAKAHIKKSIKSLSDKSWWFAMDGKKETLFRWIDTVEINGEQVDITLSSSLAPYLLDLKSDFTKYEQVVVLPLRGRYVIPLFELFKMNQYKGTWKVKISDLREMINCDKYPAFKEFNRNVLKYSIEQINSFTDIFVTYRTEKNGRAIDTIIFKIEEKEGIQMRMDLLMNKVKQENEN